MTASSFANPDARRRSIALLQMADMNMEREMEMKGARKVPQVESVWIQTNVSGDILAVNIF